MNDDITWVISVSQSLDFPAYYLSCTHSYNEIQYDYIEDEDNFYV